MADGRSGRAPIVFFGYNRGDHATKALESVKACPEAADTPITIYMDGPKSDEGVPAVEAAREAVRRVAPPHARIVLREKNLGLANSVRAGVTAACEEFGRVIVVEDDLVLAPSALTYFNQALERYRDDERVMHIAGYWPVDTPTLPPSFFLRWPSVWGWATWADSWSALEWDLAVLRDSIRERRLVEYFNQGGWDFFGQLLETLDGKYDSWGIRWYASVLLHEGLSLHPRSSMVANTGTDGSGVHGDESAEFGVLLASEVPPFPDHVAESAAAVQAWSDFMGRFDDRSIPRRIVDRVRNTFMGLLRRRTA